MARLISFTQVTLDGYFAGRNGDISWAHNQRPDAEWDAYVAANASGGGMLLFGRITYAMMASYWPTPQAAKNSPVVAERMNAMSKVLFSRSLENAAWKNTRLARDIESEVRRIKEGSGPEMAILGSGSVISQLTRVGLIDEYHVVVNPVLIGQGRTAFDGIGGKVALTLAKSRTFNNGNVLLIYTPTK